MRAARGRLQICRGGSRTTPVLPGPAAGYERAACCGWIIEREAASVADANSINLALALGAMIMLLLVVVPGIDILGDFLAAFGILCMHFCLA